MYYIYRLFYINVNLHSCIIYICICKGFVFKFFSYKKCQEQAQRKLLRK